MEVEKLSESKDEFATAIITDIDGSMMPQGGPIDIKVARFIHFLSTILKIGPATGKNVDYGRGLACGIGTVWDFIIGENGAQFLETISKGSPPAFRHHKLMDTGPDLYYFAKKIDLNPFQRTFIFRDGITTPYRPELKESIISMFPSGTDVEVTKDWVPYFEEIIKIFSYRLKVLRYSDGCIDVIPLQISKEIGVMQVCKLYGIERKNIIVVVDGTNDLELTLGTKVLAVGNAVPKIKETATRPDGFIAKHKDGLGLVEGILHYAENGHFDEQTASAIRRKIDELEIF